MLISPLIHARTKNNDFPSSLLVVPKDFSDQDIKWARKYITQSTRYFELSEKIGRRVLFSNQRTVISGLSIRIQDLYTICNRTPKFDKVDGNRTNYAFIGLAIPKSEITYAFDIPYSIFLDHYEKYMEACWDIPYTEGGLIALKADYVNEILPTAKEVCDIPSITTIKTKCVLDINYASLESMCARITQMMLETDYLGFCSDIPNANSVIESDFSIVTAKHAQSILDALEREQNKKKSSESNKAAGNRSFLSNVITKKQDNSSDFFGTIITSIEKTWKAIPKAIKVIGGLVIIVLVSSNNKSSD